MKRLLLLLFLPLAAYAQDLQTGVTFSDGDTVNAAALNNSINNATILPTFYSNKGVANPASTDGILFYSFGTSSLKQTSIANFFNFGLGSTNRNALTFFAGPGTSGAIAATPTWRVITPHDTSMPTDALFSTSTINALASRTFSRLLSANTTYTITNMIDGETITVAVRQAASGGPYTATFSGVIWRVGATPVQTTTASRVDIYTFIKLGASVFGTASQNYP